ncbi:MAG: hypothetical protein ABI839_05300 [Verrucomicrobiota bacterium]
MIASARRSFAIAGATFTELARLRVFYVLILFALVLIFSATFLARISFQQELQVTRDIALGAIDFFLSLLAIVATAQLLPRDLEDRVVYSILAKPVRRFEYLLGKFFGALALLAASLVVMSILCLIVLHFREAAALRSAQQQLAPLGAEQVAVATRAIHIAGVNPVFFSALAFTLLKTAVLVAITLAVSSFATSSIFTISALAMVFLIGHLEGIARDYWLSEHAVGWVTRAFLAVIVFVFPDFEAFNLSDQLAGSALLAAPLLLKTGLLALFYIVSYLIVAVAIFSQREL